MFIGINQSVIVNNRVKKLYFFVLLYNGQSLMLTICFWFFGVGLSKWVTFSRFARNLFECWRFWMLPWPKWCHRCVFSISSLRLLKINIFPRQQKSDLYAWPMHKSTGIHYCYFAYLFLLLCCWKIKPLSQSLFHLIRWKPFGDFL